MSKFMTHLSFRGEELRPTIQFSDKSELTPLGETLSLKFNLSERFCIGWYDMTTGEDYPCPNNAKIDKKFETCPACQRRTGFNPAFYHSDKVSPQQEARNAEPHSLYLAYMGKDYIKVGISHGRRGVRRLLDQGARAGLVLETFPTALIARQYESKSAALQGIHETTPTRTKLALLNEPYDASQAEQRLLDTKRTIEEKISATFSGNDVQLFDTFYAPGGFPSGTITPLTDPVISGTIEAFIGDILLARYDDRLVALPLKQYLGYRVEITDTLLPLDLEPEQMQLF